MAELKLPALARRSLIDSASAVLRRAILEGQLEPGTRMVEAQIARRLGTSRGPVREAIQALAREGLVEPLPRGGMLVATFSADDVWEIYTLRAALEAEAIRLLMPRLSQTRLRKLQNLIEEMRTQVAGGNVAALAALDARFHQAFVEMSGNHRLVQVWSSMMSQVQLLLRSEIAQLYTDLRIIPERHQEVLEALYKGDERLATETIDRHIRSVGERLRTRLAARPQTAAEGDGRGVMSERDWS
jgi:DNA-binding GntR family transcriptional regulator